MTRIVMLGTGSGWNFELYNTCFVIQNEIGNFLIDTGGSIEIVRRLQEINIDFKELEHIFVSHSHTDHILGLIWMMKKIGVIALNGGIKKKINIYCNDVVNVAIIKIAEQVLPDKLLKGALSVIEFHILEDNEKIKINDIDYTFFDIQAKGTKQFGFEFTINNKRVIFLGDETLNPNLYDRIKGADYVMHEAFCLEADDHIYHARQKNHATVKSVSEVMSNLNITNLILYHTEESHGLERKKLYTEEGKSYFSGNVIVPDCFEVIDID